MVRRLPAILLSVLILAAGLPTTAQDHSPWTVIGAQPLTLPTSVGLRIIPAPDGRQIAYESAVRLDGHRDYYVCAQDVTASGEPLCFAPQEALPSGFDPAPTSFWQPFGWASDSARLAVVGQPLGTQSDTDLRVLDPAAGTWVALADDGYEGPLAATEGSAGPPPGVSIEVQPAWSPDGTQVAVERTLIGESGQFAPSTLAVFDVTSGEVRDLAFLPGHQDGVADAGSVLSLAWSPDGATLAASVRHREADAESDGVWLIDVESGQMEHLVSLADAETALHGIYAGAALNAVGPLSWSPDGTRLLFWAGNPTRTPVVTWAFWIGLEDRAITALPLPAHPNDNENRRMIRPLQVTWSPDGSALLVAALGVHPDDAPQPLDPANTDARISVYVVDVTVGENHLLGHLPLGPVVPLYLASWGPEGDAVLDGYHLQLSAE